MITGPTAATFINIWNKLVVFAGVYLFHIFFPGNKLIVWVAVALVLVTDLLGYFSRKKFGQPLPEILMTIFSNIGFRFVYLTFFLDIFVNWLYV